MQDLKQDPDPKQSEKSGPGPNPEKIISDLQHCFFPIKNQWLLFFPFHTAIKRLCPFKTSVADPERRIRKQNASRSQSRNYKLHSGSLPIYLLICVSSEKRSGPVCWRDNLFWSESMHGMVSIIRNRSGRKAWWIHYIPLFIQEELQYKERICCVRTTDKLQISVIHTLSKMVQWKH